MTDIHDLEIGAPGPFLPPYDNVVRNARTIDSLGYDSMAFPDHFKYVDAIDFGGLSSTAHCSRRLLLMICFMPVPPR